MALFDVTSGNIAPNIIYQVVGGTSITYNSIVYVAGSFFSGVSGVATYTKTGGTELVTPATYYLGQSVGIENDFYLDLYNDSSRFRGFSLSLGEAEMFKSQIIRKTRKL
jgi:hypothetical protein